MRSFLFALFLLSPISALAICDLSLPQPQPDCFPSNPAPPNNPNQGDSAAPDPGSACPAPTIDQTATVPYPYSFSCSNQLSLAQADFRSCLAVVNLFDRELQVCHKQLQKRRRR